MAPGLGRYQTMFETAGFCDSSLWLANLKSDFFFKFQVSLISEKKQPATSGLYYKPMTIVNENARVINKLEASLTDDARVVIYDCHMFIVQATG